MLKRREWGGLLLLTGLEIAFMFVAIVNFTILQGQRDWGEHLSYMKLFSLIKIPVLALGALSGDGPRPEIRNRLLLRHAASLGLVLVLGAMALLAGATPLSLWYLTGFALMDAALLGLFLMVASKGRTRLQRTLSFLAALMMLIILREMPDIALKLRETRALISLSRALMALSPFVQLSAFTNGLIHWQGIAILLAMAVLPTWLVVTWRSQPPPKWQNQVVLVALALGVVALYGLLPPGDLTAGRYATPAPDFFEGISGLEDAGYEIDVTLVAPVGAEDPWIDAYLRGLDARSGAIAYHLSDPNEDDALSAMNLAENTVLVEGLNRSVLVTPDRVYPVEGIGAAKRMGFGLEGTMRAALSEAGGGTLTAEPPAAQDLTAQPAPFDERRVIAIIALCSTAIPSLLIAGLILVLRRNQHER